MKKVLLVLLIALGIQTQAQVNHCDSLNLGISISTNPLIDPTLDTAYFTPIIDTTNLNVISYVWSFYELGGTCPVMLFEKTPSYALLQNQTPIMPYDIIYVCLEVCLDTLFPSIYCVFCDTFIYNNMGLPFPNWVSINNTVTLISEIKPNIINDNKIYDILGREFSNYNSIPIGAIYIKNRKKYIKIK